MQADRIDNSRPAEWFAECRRLYDLEDFPAYDSAVTAKDLGGEGARAASPCPSHSELIEVLKDIAKC